MQWRCGYGLVDVRPRFVVLVVHVDAALADRLVSLVDQLLTR